ncbi:MAG TPA: sensor histidine kinase [Chitinophagaceae bacterium]
MDSQEKAVIVAVLIACIIIGVMIAYFVISILRQHRRTLELSKKAMLAEITTMERERSRIAADLHDDLGPVLSVIKFKVDHVEPPDEEDREQLQQASKYLDQMIEKMRSISANLMPVSLFRKGLIPSIEDYCKRLEGTGKIKIERSYSGEPVLSEDKLINLFRIIQEVLHNALKHSEASLIKLNMDTKPHEVILHIQDNGKGFDTEAIPEGNGIGLASIRNRTEFVSGKMDCESKPGRGTAYLFTIPV